MLIGISGLIGSGKTTAAKYLVEKHGFIELTFSKAIKDTVCGIFNWDRDMMEGTTKDSRIFRDIPDHWWGEKLNISYFTPRKAMTLIGTELFRECLNKNIWVLIIEDKINKILEKDSKARIVVSDCRFVNELLMVKRLGGTLVKIVKGNPPEWTEYALRYNKANAFKKYYMKLTSKLDMSPNIFNNNVHRSEYDWIGYKFDYLIDNSSAIRYLHRHMNKLVTKLETN
jgi:hypothetical protein